MTSANNKQSADCAGAWPSAAESEAFQSARAQSHSAAQWLARLANSYQVPASDGSHLHMTWASDTCAFRTNEIAPGTVVEMRLPQLELQFRENDTLTKHVMTLDDKSPAEAEAWTLIELLHRGIDREKYTKTLPYDVSNLLSGDARHYQTADLEDGFAELAGWLQVASGLFADASAGSTDGQPVKLAPEHFSLFVRLHPETDRPAIGNFLEVGFCAGVSGADEPRFYVNSKPGTSAPETLAVAEIRQRNLKPKDVSEFLDVAGRLKALST